MFNALGLCTEEDRDVTEGLALKVSTSVLYPEAIAWIKDHRQILADTSALPMMEKVNRIEAGDTLVKFVASSQNAVNQALLVDDAAYNLALQPLSKTSKADREARAKALEVTRIFFTRALKIQLGKPFRFHISAETEAEKQFAL